MSKTAKIEYSGGFHNSDSIALRVAVIDRNGFKIAKLSQSQERKLDRHFCGVAGCCCGGVLRADVDIPDFIDFVEPSYL